MLNVPTKLIVLYLMISLTLLFLYLPAFFQLYTSKTKLIAKTVLWPQVRLDFPVQRPSRERVQGRRSPGIFCRTAPRVSNRIEAQFRFTYHVRYSDGGSKHKQAVDVLDEHQFAIGQDHEVDKQISQIGFKQLQAGEDTISSSRDGLSSFFDFKSDIGFVVALFLFLQRRKQTFKTVKFNSKWYSLYSKKHRVNAAIILFARAFRTTLNTVYW